MAPDTALEAHDGNQEAVVRRVRAGADAYAASAEDYERLREQYRPESIEILMVGESRPAGGTFFYLTNSNLYFATREAFVAALGPLPSGEAFLRYLADRGVWLYDMADEPVDQLPGRPRKAAVRARIGELVELLTHERPAHVVAIKRDIGATVRQALNDAALPADRLHVVPFPLYQWRRAFVSGLADVVRRGLSR